MLPSQIDRFLIDGVAGRGGMGTVYRARDERTGEAVAVKLITDAHPKARARFVREAETLTRVRHPGVVRYIAHGELPSGEPYLVMAWIDGEDLATHLARTQVSVGAALELARGVANALAALHAQGIVHRDLKPQNILLAGRDSARPVLVDLGIARRIDGTAMTATGSILGTPQYMAPEQIAGSKDLDHRADLFALGCVLFECIVGRPMFTGDTPMAVLAKILVEPPPSLADLGVTLPAELEQLLAALLAKAPQQRPAAALDVSARLAVCIEALTRARDPRAPSTRVVTAREHRTIAVAMATGLSAGSGLLETAPADELEREDDVVRALVAPYDGQLWGLGPNRVMLTFGGAHEAADQAARAARCALLLAAARPEASIALAVGSAQVDRVPVGDVINRVAPLLGRARPGHVLVDAASASLFDVRFRVAPRGADFELTGELDTVEPPRTLLGRETRCVGRERELSTLLATLDEVTTDGVARAIVVTAPSGTGKSRLRHEFMQRVQRQGHPAAVFVARAEALRADSPLDLLATLIRAGTGIETPDGAPDIRAKLVHAVQRRIASEVERADVAEFLGEIVGAQFPSESSSRLASARDDTRLMGAQMMRAFVTWVGAECRARPVVFVVEDLHWGDHQTVRFLDAALRELPDRPFLVLALARPEVHERFPGIWKARGVAEINLGSLSARASEQLVREVLGDADTALVLRIVRRADGNAFYLEELVRAAAHSDLATIPVSVLAMVQARLESLGTKARRVLRAASVFGEAFRMEGTAALIGAATSTEVQTALDELVEREVIARRDHGDVEYVFRHALVREAAYAMLTEGDRRVAHSLAAEWLETHGEDNALLLAQHFDRAQDIVNATRCFARASRQALEKNDFVAALDRAKRAIDLGATELVLAAACAVRGKALAGLGRWAEAEHELEVALAATSEDAGEDRLSILREMYFVATFRQSSVVLRRASSEVRALAQRFGRPELIVEAKSAHALAEHADARCDEAVAQFREAISQRGDRPGPVVGLSGILFYHAGLHDEAVEINRQMLRLARDMDDHGTAVILYGNLGVSLAALGRYEEAGETFAAGRALARTCGLHTLEARTVSMSAGYRLDVLDVEGGIAAAREACELGRVLEFPTPRISSSIDLAFVALRTGALAEAASIVDAISPTIEKGTGFHGWLWRERVGVARGELDLARGDFASALRRADASIEECRRHRRLKYRAAAHAVRAQALVGLDRREEGVRGLAQFVDELDASTDPAIRLRASTSLLRLGPDERARTIALASATAIEAGLGRDDQSQFREKVAPLLARA